VTAAAVRLWLKVADATALTACEALQRALGYGRAVRSVRRSDLWAFRWSAPVEAAEVLGRLARETNLLLNPNKHHLEIRVGEAKLEPRGNVWVLVATPGDGTELEETLVRHRLAGGTAPRVRRGTLWELDLDADPPERIRLAGEIAVTRSRTSGLLANPHVEDAVVLAEPPSAARVVASLLAGADSGARVR
jgi:hypothetical protein